MSDTAWLLWFTAQIIAFVAIMAIAVLGGTGHFTRAKPAGRSAARTSSASRRHHHIPFLHRPAH